MTLNEIKQAINQLSPKELEELEAYIAFRKPHPLTPSERVALLERGASAIRESMTPEELDDLIEVINSEYIEPWDEEEWTF